MKAFIVHNIALLVQMLFFNKKKVEGSKAIKYDKPISKYWDIHVVLFIMLIWIACKKNSNNKLYISHYTIYSRFSKLNTKLNHC